MKIIGFGFKGFWVSGWNRFDAFVVLASIIDIVKSYKLFINMFSYIYNFIFFFYKFFLKCIKIIFFQIKKTGNEICR